jgi:hypothetical protein
MYFLFNFIMGGLLSIIMGGLLSNGWLTKYIAYKYNGQDKPNEKDGWTYTKYELG